jgi:hypothetical protein
MAAKKLLDSLIIVAGGAEMVLGALMAAFPNHVPAWLAWLCVGVGAATIVYGFYRIRQEVWEWLLERARASDRHHSAIRVTRTAFDEAQSISTLPSSLGGKHFLRLGNMATLRLGAPYSLEVVTLRLDATPMRLPDRKDESIAVEDFTITKGSAIEYTFDTTKNKRHEITVVGRTYIVTLLESRKLDTPNFAKPIEWVFGITEK